MTVSNGQAMETSAHCICLCENQLFILMLLVTKSQICLLSFCEIVLKVVEIDL